jgi:general secretion pathway protein C
MLGLLAWLGATIFWALTAQETPRPPIAQETDPQRAVQAIVNRHLFGVTPVGIAPGVTSSFADIKLIGAIAAQTSGKPAFAILSVEGKPSQVVREGEEAAPGITLQHVMPRQVELQRGGQSQLLTLPERGKP